MGNSAAGLTESVHVDGFSTFSFCKVMKTTQTLFGSNRNLGFYLNSSNLDLKAESNIIVTKVMEKINKC